MARQGGKIIRRIVSESEICFHPPAAVPLRKSKDMRRNSFGKFSIGFAVLAGVAFALHFANVIPILNTVFAPLLTVFGTLLGTMGYFERDKMRLPSAIGALLNLSMLIWWITLLAISLSK
jgi:hypothetical protein